MPNIVYVHAYFDRQKDNHIMEQFVNYYQQIDSSQIRGLISIAPLLSLVQLEKLVSGLNFPEFAECLPLGEAFKGAGLWTEWSEPRYIDAFYGSSMHKDFSEYANGLIQKSQLSLLVLQLTQDTGADGHTIKHRRYTSLGCAPDRLI